MPTTSITGRRRLRAGVLSAGSWSEFSHLPTLKAHPNVELVAVTRPDRQRLVEVARQFGVANAFTDWRAALELDLDLVVISSPPVAHEEQVIAALQTGADVLVEKPFAVDASAAARMVAAANRAPGHLLVGFSWSSCPLFALARSMVDSGETGRVEHITTHLSVNTRDVLLGDSAGGWADSGRSENGTYTDQAISAGGVGAVTMSHQLSILLWLTGERVVDLVAQTWPAGGLDLHASMLATLAGGGSATVTSASARRQAVRPDWTISIYGDRADLHVDAQSDQLRLDRHDGSVVRFHEANSGQVDPHAPTTALIDVGLGGSVPPGMLATLGADVVAITDALYSSARLDRRDDVTDWTSMLREVEP